MKYKKIYLDLTGREISEVLLDRQVNNSVRCLINACIEIALEREFDSNSIIVTTKAYIPQLDLEFESDWWSKIDESVRGLIQIYFVDIYAEDKIIPLVESVTNYGNKALKVTFSERVLDELKHDFSRKCT